MRTLISLVTALVFSLSFGSSAYALDPTGETYTAPASQSVIPLWCQNNLEEGEEGGWKEVGEFIDQVNVSHPSFTTENVWLVTADLSDIEGSTLEQKLAAARKLPVGFDLWLPCANNTRTAILDRLNGVAQTQPARNQSTLPLADIAAMQVSLAQYDEHINELVQQMRALTDEVADMSTQIDDVTKAVGTVTTALEGVDDRVDALENAPDNPQIAENKEAIEATNQRIDDLSTLPWWWWILLAPLAVALALMAFFVWKNRDKIAEVEDTAKRAEAAAGKANGLVGHKDTGLVAAHAKADKAMLAATRAASEARINTNHDLPERWVVIGDLPTQSELDKLPADGVALVRFGQLDADGVYVVEDKTLSFTKIPDAFDKDGQPAPGLHVEGVIGLVKPIALRVGKILHVATKAIKSNHLVGIDKDGKTQQTKTAA